MFVLLGIYWIYCWSQILRQTFHFPAHCDFTPSLVSLQSSLPTSPSQCCGVTAFLGLLPEITWKQKQSRIFYGKGPLLKRSPFTAQLSTNSSTLSGSKPVIRRYFLMDELRLVKGLSGSIENTGHAGFTDIHKQNLNTKNTSKAHKNHFQTLTNMICAQTRAKRSQELTCFTQLCSIHWPGTAFN